MSFRFKLHPAFAALVVVLLVTGCAASLRRGDSYAKQQDWLKAVVEYRAALQSDPDNVELKVRLGQVELLASEFYYQKGLALKERGENEAALAQFQQGLSAMPQNEKLQKAFAEAVRVKEADSLVKEAALHAEAGRDEEAVRLLKKALASVPTHEGAKQAWGLLQKRLSTSAEGLTLSSNKPINLNFKKTSLHTAFDFVAKSFGINIIYDEGMKDTPVTLQAKDVTFQQALQLMLSTTQTFDKVVGPNTLFIAPDTKAKRGQYEDYLIKTFQLNTVKATDMSSILKGIFNLKRVIVNDQLNTLVIRDTRDVLGLVEKVIQANDRRPAEVVFEVEILEINRTKAEQLGLNYGSQVSVQFPSFSGADLVGTSFADILRQGTVTLPSVVFNFFKQDVNAKTLANPKIRVLDGKVADIHIGDRIPLRASTIQDATGQVRNTFDYHDIGILLRTEGQVHYDNSVTVKLGLEVSTLGANLGTASEPAFSIGSRNANTFMLLRDGETVVLGGLIRDEERRTRVKVPGLGDIPLIGPLFTTAIDDTLGRTDVLLTITPRVVRGWDLPSGDLREIYSGTEENFTSMPAYASLSQTAEGGAKPVISLGEAPAATSESTQPVSGPGGSSLPAPTVASESQLRLGFSLPQYSAAVGEDIQIRLSAEGLTGTASGVMAIAYNPKLVSFSSVEGLVGVMVEEPLADAAKGVFRFKIKALSPQKDFALLHFKALEAGVSYLVFQAPALTDAAGLTLQVLNSASRIQIR